MSEDCHDSCNCCAVAVCGCSGTICPICRRCGLCCKTPAAHMSKSFEERLTEDDRRFMSDFKISFNKQIA